MSVVNFDDYQISLFKCEMILHDYLWFASYDVSSLTTTEAVIHNYALSYAINRFDRGIMSNSGPIYEEDLEHMNFYALPARAIQYKKVSITYNALDTKTLKTDQYPKKNTPKLGKKIVITPFS